MYLPVNESTLSVHEIKFVVQTSPGLCDRRGVGQHANGSLDLGEISARDDSRGLVVDTNLKKKKNVL